MVLLLTKGGVMEKDFCEQAYEGTARVIGEAVVQLLAEQRPVTNEALAERVEMMAGGRAGFSGRVCFRFAAAMKNPARWPG